MWRGWRRREEEEETRRRATTLNSNVDGVDDEVLQCVKRLEARDHLFSTYLYDDHSKGDLDVHVLGHMNECLSGIFNCRLQQLKERHMAITAVHAFYDATELHDKWCECKYPLFTGLLVCYILRKMRHVFEGINEWGMAELYRQSHKDFEEKVLEVLEKSYRRNEIMTRYALKVEYPDLIRRRCAEFSACSVHSLLDLAMMAKCERILNHNICKRISNEQWMPGISISRTHFIIAFFTFIPIFFIPFNRNTKTLTKRAEAEQLRMRRESTRVPATMMLKYRAVRVSALSNLREVIVQKLRNTRTFYSSPCSKFCLHTTFYFGYILLFASVLLHRTQFDFRFVEVSRFYRELLLNIWQLAYIADMGYTFNGVGFRRFMASNPADMTHNFFNITWIILMIISTVLHEFNTMAGLWGTLVILSRLFFLISFIFSAIRVMRVFAADSFFGAIVTMMKKMVYTLWSLFIVFLLFWVTYAIASVSLLEKDPATEGLAWKIFSNGAFEIFGELTDETKNGDVKECPQMFNTSDIRDFTIDCAFRTWMIPILLFVYVLVSSVLLVNLVTSFFTNTFEQVRDSSSLQYRYKHYQRLVEFESKLWFPAPLSLLYYMVMILSWPIRRSHATVRRFIRKRREKTAKLRAQEAEKERLNRFEEIELIEKEELKAMNEIEKLSVHSDYRSVHSALIIDADADDEIVKPEQIVVNQRSPTPSGTPTLEQIVEFIHESMRIVQKEKNSNFKESGLQLVLKGKSKKPTAPGLHYVYWRTTKTGKRKMVYARVETAPS